MSVQVIAPVIMVSAYDVDGNAGTSIRYLSGVTSGLFRGMREVKVSAPAGVTSSFPQPGLYELTLDLIPRSSGGVSMVYQRSKLITPLDLDELFGLK
jgi:hypothetical protein